MNASVLERAIAFTSDPQIKEIQSSVQNKQHRALGPTILDGVGIAILRTPGAPERAAVGIAYGDTMHHRHRDLLDVQLFAFDRPISHRPRLPPILGKHIALGGPLGNPQHRLGRPAARRIHQRGPWPPRTRPLHRRHPGPGHRSYPLGTRS